jgi:hypothetical protein
MRVNDLTGILPAAIRLRLFLFGRRESRLIGVGAVLLVH